MVGAGDDFVSPGIGGLNTASSGVYGTLAVNIGGGARFASINEGTGTGANTLFACIRVYPKAA